MIQFTRVAMVLPIAVMASGACSGKVRSSQVDVGPATEGLLFGDGAGRDGAAHDGPTSDGPTHDGPTHDGPTHDGPGGDGPGGDGQTQADLASGDSPMHEAAPPDLAAGDQGIIGIFAGEPNVEQHARSGSRLQARMRTTEDGDTFFESWYDTQLKVDCAFAKAADGKLRCVPAVEAGRSSWTTRFADSQCRDTNRQLSAISTGDACASAPPKFATEHKDCRVRVYPTTGGVTSRGYYVGIGTACLAIKTSVPTVSLGGEQAASGFVEGTIVDGPEADGLVARYVQTAGGAVGFAGWFDAGRKVPCAFYAGPDGVFRCLSGHVVKTTYFADAACTQRAALVTSCAKGAAALVVSSAGSCGPSYQMHQPGTTLSRVYTKASTLCLQRNLVAGESAFRLGTTVSTGTIPSPKAAPLSKGPRLKRAGVQVGTLRQPVGPWQDTQRGGDCEFKRAGDGSLRCLPLHLKWRTSGQFADATCQTALAAVDKSACASSAPNVALIDDKHCPHRKRIHGVGSTFSGKPYLKLGNSTGCISISATKTAAKVGTEVAPTVFSKAR